MRALAVFLVVIALWASPMVALGQTAADRETARQLMDAGDAKLAKDDVKGALAAYESADKIMNVPTTGLAVGKARMQLAKLVDARDVLLRVARFPEKADEPEVFKDARKEADALAESLAPRIPTVRIVVVGPPKGAPLSVSIDESPVPGSALAFPRSLDPGAHELVAAAPGFKEARQRFTIQERENKTVELRLEKDPSAGLVGSDLGKPGPKPPTQNDTTPPSKGPAISTLVWVGAAIAGAGVIVGAIMGGIALDGASALESECPEGYCDVEHRDDISRTRALSHASTASFAIAGAGGVLLVVGLAISDWGDGAPSESAVQVRLGAGMLMLEGTFR